ncbi:hypothetical protein [Sedimenticola thiotaurini]|uniref:Nuclear transport factor 2 family protein n=1 Tax=Sedimenticola thiotaurini TaxID=1543721 RepID=A0A0F7K0T0_9GAMM|nr:hypothetical protein [Sedimenticola thiotaurini]AKH21507.1 hypothetical protein AAY24_15370 [Sedimenticola thiotaurini]
MNRLKLQLGSLFMLVMVQGIAVGSEYELLVQAINRYYAFEKNSQWDKAYNERVSEFREITEKEYYITRMEQDSLGWKLIEWEILKVEKLQNSETIVVIEFVEQAPNVFKEKMNLENNNTITFSEQTVWQKEKDRWFCRVCATRFHMTLNRGI